MIHPPKKGVISLFIFVFFLSVILFLSSYSAYNRVYAKSPQVEIVPEPYYAHEVWKTSGVKGRILVLFDRHIGAEPLDTLLSNDNYVYLSTKKNMVRRVYHIIPDDSWEEVKKTLTKYPLVSYSKGVFRTFFDDGSFVFIMRLRDITPVKEKVLLNINGNYWDENSIQKIINMINNKILNSDIITITGNISENNLKEISGYEKIYR